MGIEPAITDRRLLLLHPRDNVCVAIAAIRKGTLLLIQDREVIVDRDIPLGFKISVQEILSGQNIMKYGVPIGHASQDIKAGEVVHLHNLASNYIPTQTHGNQEHAG